MRREAERVESGSGKGVARRVLVLSHTTGYQLRAFDEAAARLGIGLVFATDRCHRLDDPWQDHAVAVRFDDPDASMAAIAARAAQTPVHGIIAVGDRPVVLAARAAAALGLRWHTVAGAAASTDKRRSRAAIAAEGLPAPRFAVLPASDGLGAAPPASPLAYPVVLKPVGLSGSRGVIRANDEVEFRAAFDRIAALLARPQVRAARAGLEDEILVEEYIDGREFALEGVMTAGVLQTLALFDKPDPLEGPYFEETIYATPSALPAEIQARIAATVQRAASALGLLHGPVHAECRLAAGGEIYALEVAARPIGGLCSRVLTFTAATEAEAAGGSLEAVLLRHALGDRVAGAIREPRGAAVMMIPIPRRGMLRGVGGEEAARRIAGVTDLRITAKIGQLLEPLPEAGSYLGFIFARGVSAPEAVSAVRAAHAALEFTVASPLAVVGR